jgi:hypothetical protein
LDAGTRVTRACFHTVLVLVPTITAGTRLMDLVPLLEGDHRVQVVFTVPQSHETWHGADEFVRRFGGFVLPWQQALQHRWDLVLSASHQHIEQVHGNIMIVPHGTGHLMSRRYSRKAGTPTRATTGLDREVLTYRGRVIPAAIGLTHDHELDALRESCPEAVHTAVVVGDICLDRMTASTTFRQHYRRALGVGADQELITVSSTWSSDSTFGRHLDLYGRLLEHLPADRARVAAVLHPNVWAVHGAWQVRAWLASAVRRGLILIPPDEGWRATMIASDKVIGDHGSTTSYAAAIGVPVCLATLPEHNIRRGSAADCLAGIVPRLDYQRPLVTQVRHLPVSCPAVAGLVSSRPGQAARLCRTIMYRLLGLPQPTWPAAPSALPLPVPMSHQGDRL